MMSGAEALVVFSSSKTKTLHVADPTEPIRCQRLAEINAEPGSREALELQHGQVWSTEDDC